MTSASCRNCYLPLLKMRKLRLKALELPEGRGERGPELGSQLWCMVGLTLMRTLKSGSEKVMVSSQWLCGEDSLGAPEERPPLPYINFHRQQPRPQVMCFPHVGTAQ
ncbi:rCG46842 [Rattus norvegicus]|uniref:RCG46842 n=1 Tax=Rattus norvegicus TaxID=10116 RepID=A6IXH0_RAT|nr:rCG46842 [Rattus norvegicus]